MKLNVGSGYPEKMYRNGAWINLDLFGHKRVNVRGDMLTLPFATGSIEEIHSIHVLEHLTRDKYPAVLREMHRVLKPGGACYVEVPDFKGTVRNLMAAFDAGDVRSIHIWSTSIYGRNERPGMAHHVGFYEGLLRREMMSQGFSDVIRLKGIENMISGHYRQEPVLLVRGSK